MDDNTRFLVERMDKMESRINKKLDALMSFKNKAVGASVAITTLISGAVSMFMQFLIGK
jgi:hypothetical protein